MDLSDIVRNSSEFDCSWYVNNYKDVVLSGVEPARHFARYGSKMGRFPSAGSVDRSMSLRRALDKTPVISYCIPVMDRIEDLKLTLEDNLRENIQYSNEIEFIIKVFDEDDFAFDWVKGAFQSYIDSGYLRILKGDDLKWWHFGRAKNSFRSSFKGELYSSLDGDNFVTSEETEQLLDVYNRFGGSFVFHHFTGDWGDGTSGRITLPRAQYLEKCYDDRMLPRQYDEVDALITALRRMPGAAFLRYATDEHVFSTKLASEFCQGNLEVADRTCIMPAVRRIPAANPRGKGYVREDVQLSAMQNFNQNLSYWKNALPASRDKYLTATVKARHRLIEALPAERVVPYIVTKRTNLAVPDVASGELSLFACVKDDGAFLSSWYAHYSALGVKHFFIVDDGSQVPVEDVLPFENVYVFQPEVGSFITSKGLWLEAVMKAYIRPGSWVITVDADEFIDPLPGKSLTDLLSSDDVVARGIVPCMLVDLFAVDLPGQEMGIEEVMAGMNCMSACEVPISDAYANHGSVRWGFGPFSPLSWALDARYHAFGTFDSLRKLSIFRYEAGRHLNQGFHDIHHKSEKVTHDLWRADVILPIRHYKLLKLFHGGLHKAIHKNASNSVNFYHSRTAQNIEKIFGSDNVTAVAALSHIKKQNYSPKLFQNLVDAVRRVSVIYS